MRDSSTSTRCATRLIRKSETNRYLNTNYLKELKKEQRRKAA